MNWISVVVCVVATPLCAQLRIIDPKPGAYLSGPYEIRIESHLDDVVRTVLYVDGEVAATREGAASRIELDFGEEIKRHELTVEMIDASGSIFRSPTVTTRALRVDYQETTRLVLVSAIVKTRSNKALLDLSRDDFRVLEEDEPLEIRSFMKEEVPLDLVLLLDTSSSMKEDIDALRKAAALFVMQLDPPDRVSIIEFNNEPKKLIDFSTNRKRLLDVIAGLNSYGETALFDALEMGILALKDRRRGRRAVVLFTDGRDSRYEEPETKRRLYLRTIAMAQDCEINLFTLGLGKKIHEAALQSMAMETGGRYYFARKSRQLETVFSELLSDLRSLYLLGVVPRNDRKGFHALEISVRKSGARVYARKGYTL